MKWRLFYFIWAATGPCGPAGSGGLDGSSGSSGLGGPTGSSGLGGPSGSGGLAKILIQLVHWRADKVEPLNSLRRARFWLGWNFLGFRRFQFSNPFGFRREKGSVVLDCSIRIVCPHKGQKRELRVRWLLEKRIQTAPQFELTFKSRSNFELLLYSFQVAVEIVWIHFTHLEIWLTRDWLTWWLVPADMSCRFQEIESESRG